MSGRRQGDPLGRKLTKLLRHRVHENGLGSSLRPDGYVPLDAVLSLDAFRGVTVDEVRHTVATNDKQRLALMEQDGALWIRANQGHSCSGISDEALLEHLNEASLTALKRAVHGTYHSAWPAIIASRGLHRMSRQHIHLATGLPNNTGVISGMRKSAQVAVWVDLLRAHQAGITFYRSQNGVILTPGDATGSLSSCFFARVEDLAGGREWCNEGWGPRRAEASGLSQLR